MKRNQGNALVAVLSGTGVMVLLVGALTNAYEFSPDALLGALSAWILAITVSQYLGPTGQEPTE